MNYKIFNGTTLIDTVTSKNVDIAGLQPSTKYTFGVQANNGLRDGVKKTIDVTTRGARFTIPKTITAGTNITLRYVEYPFGSVPIGNEPSGMFGGGNRQNLSAKVISTANGSSVVEVSGDIIEVGSPNYLLDSDKYVTVPEGHINEWKMSINATELGGKVWTVSLDVNITNITSIATSGFKRAMFEMKLKRKSDGVHDYIGVYFYPSKIGQSFSGRINAVLDFTDKSYVNETASTTFGEGIYIQGITADKIKVGRPKIELGSIATPYASFQDGSTFTKQSDGTFALFSEYKAIYY